MAPPFGFTFSLSSGSPSVRVTASACAANASFNSKMSMSFIDIFNRASSFFTAGIGPMPITRGSTPAVAEPTTRAMGVNPNFAAAASEATNNAHAPSLMPEAFPAVTVPFSTKRRGQLRELFKSSVGADVFVFADDFHAPFRAWHVHRHDFFGEDAIFLRGGCFLLGAKRKLILAVPVDVVCFGDVLRRFSHRVGAVFLFHQWVDEAPAESRIVNLRVAREGRRRFGYHERTATHAFDAARNPKRNFARGDGARDH